MSDSKVKIEVAKLDPADPNHVIFVKALKRFDGLTAENLKVFVERHGLHGPLVHLLRPKGGQG